MAVLPTGIGPVTGYNIERSLRFNSADTAYLNRTPASAGNRKTWTWSGWVKRSALGSAEYLFAAGTGGTDTTQQGLNFQADNTLRWTGSATVYLVTTQVFRDPSAWYHVVFVFDTTQATANNRQRIYVNGVQITAFSTQVNPTQNLDYAVNQAAAFNIGRWTGASNYFNGYMTEVNFVDSPILVGSTTNASTTVTLTTGTTANIGIGWNVGGTNIPSGATVSSITNSTQFVISSAATGTGSSINIGVTPPVSAFGETDTNTGVWKPKAYSGTYGTNGFYLKFADNSNTTAATLGKDSSGNGNNWTPNLFSVTDGAGNDSLVDSPTSYGTDTGVGGEVRGNYATFNSVETNYGTLSNGNLNASLAVTGTTGRQARGTFLFPSSGKYYFEVNPTTLGVAGQIGIAKFSSATNGGNGITPAFSAGDVYLYLSNGQKQDGVTSSAYGASYTTTNIIGVAVDVDNSTLTFYKDGVSQGTAYSSVSLSNYYPVVHAAGASGTSAYNINFGQRPFEKWNGSAYVANTAPSGFKALCTQNFTTPTIGATSTTQANDYFNAVLYTGNGSSQTVTGFGFNPDMVWHKGRSVAYANSIVDVIRGNSNVIFTNTTDAEQNPGAQLALATDGATVTYRAANLANNQNAATYVIWGWKANGTGVTNTAGTITSTVSANTTSGFSIVTYTGNGSSSATVGHGLGVSPTMIIVKNRTTGSTNWPVWHTSLTNETYTLYLDTTLGQGNTNNPWGSGSISSTTFHITATGTGNSNQSSANFVAYCFAPVAGYSAFGSYTGNGSTDGPFVYTGFRPAFVMVKVSSTTDDWIIEDNKRNTYNPEDAKLSPNLSTAEITGSTYYVDFLSNGFKLRNINGLYNTSSATYIYAAFAESPFKYALAR